MSYVIAAYIAVFGAIGLYMGRLFVRARAAAAAVLKLREATDLAGHESNPSPSTPATSSPS